MEINPFSAILPNLEKITYPDDFFQSAKEKYLSLAQNGFFYPSPSPAVYLQQISSAKHSYLGIIASVPTQAYHEGYIKGHEETLEEKGRIQLALLQDRQAMVKPVLLTYHKVAAIQQWVQDQITFLTPLQAIFFEQDQAYYKLWEVRDGEAIRTIQHLFREEVNCTYIADGHHRMLCATAEDLQVRSVLCSFYPRDQVLIRDFNRQLFFSEDFDTTQFLQCLRKVADLTLLTSGRKPGSKNELSLYLNQQWYSLRWKDQIMQKRADNLPLLDASILNEVVLRPLLGVDDLRKSDKVQYIGGQNDIHQLEALIKEKPNSLLFCLFPVDWSEMVQWANRGHVLPPKSTWFEPRMKNGLVVQELQGGVLKSK